MAKAINMYIKLINLYDSKEEIILYILSTIELNMVYKSLVSESPPLIFIHPLHHSWEDGLHPGILLHNLTINKSRIQVRAALKDQIQLFKHKYMTTR